MANKFKDPLDELINQHRQAQENQGVVADTNVTEIPIAMEEPITAEIPVAEDTMIEDTVVDYGDDDLEAQIKAEEAAEEARRQEALKLKHEAEEANKKNQLPPRSLDKDFQAEAIGYQAEKLEIVSAMVKKVIAKNNLGPGHIINEEPNQQYHIMGELIDIYHNTGEEITPEFEKMVIDNWVAYADDSAPVEEEATTASAEPVNKSTTETSVEPKSDTKDDASATIGDIPVININVEKDTPVTVNIDESVMGEVKKKQALNIFVNEVSEDEIKATTIIENSNKKGLIKPYDSGINDVPITLPMSAYRCVLRSINWFDFIKLSAPTSNNPADIERKKWSVIYDHIKNVSIGDFANFEDFLKKTKYADRELLMWAILVATADDEEDITIKCNNPKCNQMIKTKYTPRNIIKLDEKRIPKYYNELHNAAPGAESYKIWEKVAGSRRRYKLPSTGIIVEINEPSAYEFITEKLTLTQEIYERYRPGEKMGESNLSDAQMMEFDYIAGNALMVSAMSIPDGDKEYRFTNWEDIEKIITTMLDAEDSAILLQITGKARELYISPVTFKLNDIECESCKHINDNLLINDISESLLFQVSRRLASTDINLIEMQ